MLVESPSTIMQSAGTAAHGKSPSDLIENASLDSIPVIDLGPLMMMMGAGHEPPASPEAARERIVMQISEACEIWGFFQIINHGVPRELLDQNFARFAEFCSLPHEEKLKAKQKPDCGAPVRAGFIDDDLSSGKPVCRQRLSFYYGQWSIHNIWPEKPAHLRETLEAYIEAGTKLCSFVIELVFEGLGLSQDSIPEIFFKEVNNIFMAHHYPPSKSGFGTIPHKDANVLTLLAQDDVGGLEVLKDDKWWKVSPIKEALIINIGDVLQVWTNGKYKSVTHRVANHPNKSRYSFPLFINPPMDMQVFPLIESKEMIGFVSKYRCFHYEEYLLLRLKNKEIASEGFEEIGIEFYAI